MPFPACTSAVAIAFKLGRIECKCGWEAHCDYSFASICHDPNYDEEKCAELDEIWSLSQRAGTLTPGSRVSA
jgi:hypothetical protein